MHKTLRLVAGYYRKSARASMIVLLALSLFGPALAAAQSNSTNQVNLTASLVVTAVELHLHTVYSVDGNVSVSGTYGGPIYFNGTAVLTFDDGENLTQQLVPNDFSPSPLSFPSATTVKLHVVMGSTAAPSSTRYSYGYVIDALSGPNGPVIGTTSQSSSPLASNNPTYHYIVELPLFNDTMLGASASCHNPSTSFEYPCSLPLGDYYNHIAFVAVIVSGIGFLVSLASAQLDEKERRKNQLFNLIIAVIFIFAFPVIYTNVASLMNYLNASVIAGPASTNVGADLGNNINIVWSAATPNLGSVYNLFFGGNLLTLAGWLISLFTYIGVYVLGIIRLWLLAAMIVAFPVSLAIKEIPFARKLSNMIEDTFYGIVLASLMSAIVIGLAANIIGTSSGNLPDTSIFGGGSTTFVASIALLTAIFMPTILAPLTGTLMQTGQQMAMAAGGIAALAATGGAMGGVGGFASGAMSPAGLAKAGVTAEQFAGMSTGQRLSLALQNGSPLAGIAGALGGGFKNVGVAAMTGTMTGMGGGMYQASKVIGRIAPISTPGEMGYAKARGLGMQVQAQQVQEAGQLVAQHDQSVNRIFSAVGSVTPEFNGQMKQVLGTHHVDISTPEGKAKISSWYANMKNAKDSSLVDALSQHKIIDGAKYRSNPAYKQAIDGKIPEWKQKLNELNPEVNETNYQRLADLKNLMNYGFHKGKEA